jgi:hypothetical protein
MESFPPFAEFDFGVVNMLRIVAVSKANAEPR